MYSDQTLGPMRGYAERALRELLRDMFRFDQRMNAYSAKYNLSYLTQKEIDEMIEDALRRAV